MKSTGERIREIEEEIRKTPYNKATAKHIGRLKAKLARLKEEKLRRSSKRGGRRYAVGKSGDATVILVGFPSVGKSTLLNSLTGARAEVANYDFTTLEVIPGTLKYGGADIQILDVPGIISGASEGRGHGKEVLSVIRNADLLLLMLDPFNLEQYKVLKRELHDAGVRLNQEPPKVKIQLRGRGGLNISFTVSPRISEEEIREILRENRILNADVVIEEDLDSDRLIDAVMANRKYVSALALVNKIDLLSRGGLEKVKAYVSENVEEEVMYISAAKGDLEPLKRKIFEKLNLIRVYLKPRGEKVVDRKEPMVLRRGSTVADLCRRIHGELVRNFRYARVWGRSTKYPGQRVGATHELADGDVVSIVA